MIYRLGVPYSFDDTDAVRVLEWHAAPGSAIEPDQLVVELETHKALVEVRAGQAGILRAQFAAEGEWCPLGGTLALLSDEGDETLGEAGGEWTAEFTIG
jgi:pyruvate/2-oxoglutarate dehydrogenase complex dihydrolipoamide acyltransferase (E2) component